MVPVDPPVRVPPGEDPDDPPTGALSGPPPVPAPGCVDDGISVVRVVAKGTPDEGFAGVDG